jgi:four helix bundle protein
MSDVATLRHSDVARTLNQLPIICRNTCEGFIVAARMAIKSYKDLNVWQQSLDLSVDLYQLTSSFPRAEMFGLTTQIRRAASSIPANIAEGWGREGTKEFIQFLRVAQGSCSELETHLILSERLGFSSAQDSARRFTSIENISKMLRSLIRSLQTKLGAQKNLR